MPFDAATGLQASTSPELAIVDGMMALLQAPEDWCQGTGSRRRPDGGVAYCLIWAWDEAAKRLPCDVARFTTLGKLYDQCGGPPGTALGGWVMDFNDRPTTTFADIRRVLEAVRDDFAATSDAR